MEAIIIILLVGIGLAFVGYGPLSMKKHPTAGVVVAIVGFLARFAALLLIIFSVLLLLIALSMRYSGGLP